MSESLLNGRCVMASKAKINFAVNGTNEARLRRNASYCDSEYQTEKRRKAYSTPDRPCHEQADSLFSSSSGFNNYRGILNWCIILLALATGRAALENIMKYGILIDPVMWLSVFLEKPYSWPSFYLAVAVNIFILVAFFIEMLLSQGKISERFGSCMLVINLFIEITFPAVVVLIVHPSPFTSSPALAVYVVVFLKLISYKQVNSWCREYYASQRENKLRRNRTMSHSAAYDHVDNFKKKNADKTQVYPENINYKDLYYFMFAPTLCYELNFPRSARIRKRFLLKRVVEMIFLCGLMLSLIQQWIFPTVNNMLIPFKEQVYSHMVERLLKLALPNHFIWLIFFYWLFHSCLNVAAEVLCFGDRIFYKDWWNAETVQYFWRTWNIPVHKWASRHLYKPMVSAGISRFKASIAVFLVSAFFHEYLVSVPLRMFRYWAFMGLLSQVPLAMFTSRYLHGKYGNMVVWMSLIIGQPIAILMYYHDYYILNL